MCQVGAMFAGTLAAVPESGVSNNGYIVYFSDRRAIGMDRNETANLDLKIP